MEPAATPAADCVILTIDGGSAVLPSGVVGCNALVADAEYAFSGSVASTRTSKAFSPRLTKANRDPYTTTAATPP